MRYRKYFICLIFNMFIELEKHDYFGEKFLHMGKHSLYFPQPEDIPPNPWIFQKYKMIDTHLILIRNRHL